MVVTTEGPDRDTQHWRVSAEGRRVAELALAGLRDEELGADINEIRTVTAGPSADDVTFSGRTTTALGPVRRIYQRAAAGGAVRALTPADNRTVPLHRFGATGQTAYDVGRELVLLERTIAARQR